MVHTNKYLELKIKRKQGFTIIEMVIGIAIISVLAAIAIPNLGPTFDRYRLKDATRDLVSFMQDAKMAALAQNSDQTIRFNDSTSPGFYYWDLDGSTTLSSGEPSINLDDYGSSIDYGSGSTTSNWDGITITELVTFTGDQLSFTDRGMGDSGTVYLQNQNDDICFAVTVLMTGSIKVREWDGTVWNE